MLETDQSDSWKRAKSMVARIGTLSGTFTGAVRSLLTNEDRYRAGGGLGLSPQSRLHVTRLLRSQTMLSHFYYATATFFPNELDRNKPHTVDDLVALYSAPDLAATLATTYLYSKTKKRTPDGDWNTIAPSAQLYVELGAHLGNALFAVGIARGILVASLRYLAWATFAMHDSKAFKKYRISVKMQKAAALPNLEQELFGTDHLQCGAIILQSLGYGIEYSRSYHSGISRLTEDNFTDHERKFRVTQLWLDSLALKGEAPETTLGDDFYLPDDRMEAFVQNVQNALSGETSNHWLERTKRDIGPNATPNFTFTAGPLPKASAGTNRRETRIIELNSMADDPDDELQELPENDQAEAEIKC